MNLKKIVAIALMGILLTGCSETSEDKKHGLDKENPITITMGTLQDDSLETMINDFNSSIGATKGINIVYTPVSAAEELSTTDMVSADYDTIYSLCTTNEVAELSNYFSAMDLGSTFFESSVETVSLSGLRAIPISLDVNLLVVNLSEWENFANANGLDTSSFNTWEGINLVAESYYNSTGKPFISISSGYDVTSEMANQGYAPLVQTSKSGASINVQSDTLRNVWNYIAEPQIKGYMTIGGYETIENNTTIATYCPLSEIPNSTESELLIFKAPSVNEEVSSYVLDTTAIAVNSSNDATIYACVQFIDYLIDESCNYEYATSRGCIPANKNSNVNEDSNSINNSAKNIAFDLISNGEVFKVSPFDNVSTLEDTLESKINQTSAHDTVVKRISGGILESKAYEGILDVNSFKYWYDDICDQLKITFSAQ